MSSDVRGASMAGQITVTSEVDPTTSWIRLLAPSPGIWRNQPKLGSLIRPGQSIGELEVLGQRSTLVVPSRALGLVVPRPDCGRPDKRVNRPVQYGEILITLDPQMIAGAIEGEAQGVGTARGSSGLCVRSPSSGRYYGRPSPDRAPFVQVGGLVRRGQTVAMLEVMKTFTRIQLSGDQVPDKVRVTAVLVQDEDELAAGDVILEYELIDGEP